MKKINEGQTQVYVNGAVEPQYGVNTMPHHLNPPKQLLDIIEGLKTGTPKSDAQLLAILVGMGIEQKMAETAIAMHNQINIMENQKNHNKMKFTLANLYEQVNLCINQLKQITSDKGRVSYSTQGAISVLESSLSRFPMRFKEGTSAVISEEVENSVNPSLKFSIAKNIYNQLSASSWVEPVSNLREFIENLYNENKFLFRVNHSIENLSSQKSKLHESLTESFTALLNESNEVAKEKFKVIHHKNPWSVDCKAIDAELKIEESKLVDTTKGKVVPTFSPVHESENGLSFFLHGKVWTISNGEIKEGVVNDTKFYNVVEGLKHFKLDGDNMITFGQNGKTLEYNITEGKLTYGDTDMTNASIIELKEALNATNFSGYRDMWKNDTICRFFESVDLLYTMDNFTTIQSQEFLNLYLTVIAVEEGIFINKVNPSMHLNEMVKVESATDAVKIAKDFMNCDISDLFRDKLVKENNEQAIRDQKIALINDRISFLEEKKSDIEIVISQYGETSELNEALNVLNKEIQSNEAQLTSTHTA